MYSPQLVQRMEKGAMRRTVCDLGPDPLGAFVLLILDGSKSGGYHLVRTFRSDMLTAYSRGAGTSAVKKIGSNLEEMLTR